MTITSSFPFKALQKKNNQYKYKYIGKSPEKGTKITVADAMTSNMKKAHFGVFSISD